MSDPLSPDLLPFESTIQRQLALLESADPPADLKARILAAAEPGVGSPFRAGLAALAASVVLGLGVGLFANSASRASPQGAPPILAVVDDPGMPLLAGLEPAGSLGPDDEVILDHDRR